ncbi:MAG: hypothetical protein AAGJ83_02825 [Planctomycetota bacterium]
MRTLTISKYSDLTDEQWRRVAATAVRRVKQITGERCQIGIGPKYTRGRSTSRLSVRVYLDRKLDRVAVRKRLPEHFRLRLRRPDGRYDVIHIATDVEPLTDFVPTGARVRHRDGEATTGLLVRWIEADEVGWGFLVPAHFFAGTRLCSVTVRADRSTRFLCRRRATARKRDRVDVAVLQIRGKRDEIESKLMATEWIKSLAPRGLKFVSTRVVHRNAVRQRRGTTFAVKWNRAFTAEEVFPNGFRLGERLLDDCIRVGRARKETFRPGTSGSMWRLSTDVACLQVGGRQPEFREGIGQPIDRISRWFRSRFGDQAHLVAAF